MRTMALRFENVTLYTSSFDEKTGAIVRSVAQSDPYGRHDDRLNQILYSDAWRNKYKYRSKPFSPSPETVDISITDQCSMSCPYCYQDSRPRRKHAPAGLAEQVVKGFAEPPYQLAIGGGEPTQHPELPDILRTVRRLGTVPNYTTAGHAMTDEIVRATNEVCGGVAVTYHAFKGLPWFIDHYKPIRDRLMCQVNVHLIADRDVAKNLVDLTRAQKGIGTLNLVLLAYYPDVGRASMDSLMTRTVYMKHLPEAIKYAKSSGMKIAFSEGLLPYFNSRPDLGIETTLSTPSEGVFSCYVDPKGRMSDSSFNPPEDREGEPTVWDKSSQSMWDELQSWGHEPNGEPCYDCAHRSRCSTPHKFHYLTCAYASHNTLPVKGEGLNFGARTSFERILDEDED